MLLLYTIYYLLGLLYPTPSTGLGSLRVHGGGFHAGALLQRGGGSALQGKPQPLGRGPKPCGDPQKIHRKKMEMWVSVVSIISSIYIVSAVTNGELFMENNLVWV